MKLSVEMYILAERFGDLKAAEIIKDAGFDAIDYSYYYNKENDVVLGENYKEYAADFRAHLDTLGLECNQAHAPFTLKYDSDEETYKEKFKIMVRSLESASILGAKNIIVHSLTVPEGVDFEKYNIEYYKSFIPYCEKFGICVAVENLFTRDLKRKRFAGKIGTPEELNRIVEKINSPWVVACIDVAHAALTGYEPENFIKKVNPEIIKALHVHDNDYLDDRHILPYTGKFNWQEIMTSLKKAGYDGELTFEIVKYFDGFPNELLPDVTKFAALVGKNLIEIYNKA